MKISSETCHISFYIKNNENLFFNRNATIIRSSKRKKEKKLINHLLLLLQKKKKSVAVENNRIDPREIWSNAQPALKYLPISSCIASSQRYFHGNRLKIPTCAQRQQKGCLTRDGVAEIEFSRTSVPGGREIIGRAVESVGRNC